jgi:hypothetical protein
VSAKKVKEPQPRSSWRSAIYFVLTLAVVAGLVWGVKWLGEGARQGIGPRDRYEVRFLDIDCDPPPGLTRMGFLSEVRFVSKFPDTFQSLDPELNAKLSAAFGAHPWVAAVESVAVDPEQKVRVTLRYRVPALALRTGGGVRFVDAGGVLLPRDAKAEGLPEWVTEFVATDAGQVWSDPDVKRALELVAAHHPRTLEATDKAWRLTLPDGKVVVVDK